jgi:hypothetical protein
MSRATETLLKRLVVLATIAGLGSAIAFLLVACGGVAEPHAVGPASPWQKLRPLPVEVDTGLTTVWTSKQLIVFGSNRDGDVAESYDPAAKAWTLLSPPHADAYAPDYNAVWNGEEMLAFGALHSVAYDPASKAWRTLRRSVGGGIVVWTGREAIGWGGGCCGDAWGNGLAYDPGTDSYRKLAPSPLAPSQHPIGAWTGRELVLFSGALNPAEDKPYPASLARAAAYNPATDTWHRITPLPASGRGFGGAAAWDGHEVLIAGDGASARAAFAYDPATNQRRSLAPMPFGLREAQAFWTGDRLLVWGVGEATRGLEYDLRADRWSALPPVPLHGYANALGWTGRSLIVATGIEAAAFTPAG